MKWHVAIVGINQEFIAQRRLEADGVETYCPVGTRVIRHARRSITRMFPVITRYIFIKFDHQTSWPTAEGVIDILSNNLVPVAVPSWKIEEFREREKSGEFNIKPKSNSKSKRWSRGFEIIKSLLTDAQKS